MTGKEKRELVEKKIAEGDTRSYNELMADLELQIWTEKKKGQEYVKGILYDSYMEVGDTIKD